MSALATFWLRAMPAVFVLIWSTGFVVARSACRMRRRWASWRWRYALSIAAFGVWIVLARACRGRAGAVNGCTSPSPGMLHARRLPRRRLGRGEGGHAAPAWWR